jgi:hypothetical protein
MLTSFFRKLQYLQVQIHYQDIFHRKFNKAILSELHGTYKDAHKYARILTSINTRT